MSNDDTPRRDEAEWSDPAVDGAPDSVTLSPAEEAARKRRNRMIALGLVGFIALIFLTTVVRLSTNYNSGPGG
ncbi:MAG: hypothetical protein AAFX09_07340 [Pseudomonadota bacterium]